MFILRGKINGFVQTIIWQPGPPPEVVTNPITRDRLMRLVGKQVRASPTGPTFTGGFDLDYVAYVTIMNVFDMNHDIPQLIQGECPEIPGFRLPPGAID